MANILASSLINRIQVTNAYTSQKPYVVFTVGSPTNVRITIENANDEDGYRKVISGSSTAVLTDSSFRTGTGSTALNLLECLKLNSSVFYNITLATANSVKAFIDTSIKYSITVSGSGISVGGTYVSYSVHPTPKVVVMLGCTLAGETVNIPMEKYSEDSLVYFNVTSPFERMTFFKPINVNVAAYTVYNSVANVATVPYASYTVLPTTLKQFQTVDYSNYYLTSSGKKHFLTTNETRFYNYGERYGLSFLSDGAVTLKKAFYTNGGVFLESQTTCELIERNGLRSDFYDLVDLDSIEARYNKQVGYFNVIAMSGSTEVSYPVKFVVTPRCSQNNEVFFLNELGGIDSFNFNTLNETKTSIADNGTFMRNPLSGWSDTYMIEGSAFRSTDKSITISKDSVDRETVEWLEQLGKSKYTYLWTSSLNPKFTMIMVDNCSMTSNSKEDEFNVSITYHLSDDKLPF